MTRTLCPAAAIALSALLSTTGAFGAETKTCKEFDVFSSGDARQTQYIDLDGSGGNSAGDKLIGFRVLEDANGEKVGERYFTGMIHEVDAEGKEIARTSEVVVVLKTGAIYATKERIKSGDLHAKIIGGTGEFLEATGREEVSRNGTSAVYHFRVNCPDAS